MRRTKKYITMGLFVSVIFVAALAVCWSLLGKRSYAGSQETLLQQEIAKNERFGMSRKEALNDALRTVAPSGYSEHETGLCVDITAKRNQQLNKQQEDMPENRWLQKHCAEYGFILRYPKGKEKITGYDYEPWHFRYVGKKAAKEIMQKNITLEEYLQEKQVEVE